MAQDIRHHQTVVLAALCLFVVNLPATHNVDAADGNIEISSCKTYLTGTTAVALGAEISLSLLSPIDFHRAVTSLPRSVFTTTAVGSV